MKLRRRLLSITSLGALASILALLIVFSLGVFINSVADEDNATIAVAPTQTTDAESVPAQTAEKQPPPKPPQAGNAGLLKSKGTITPALALMMGMMGIAAAALVAGARIATREP